MKLRKSFWAILLLFLLSIVLGARTLGREGFADDPYLRELKRSKGYYVEKPSDKQETTYESIYNKLHNAFDWRSPGELTSQEVKDIQAKERDTQLKIMYGEDSREYILAKLKESPKRTEEEIQKFMALYNPFRN